MYVHTLNSVNLLTLMKYLHIKTFFRPPEGTERAISDQNVYKKIKSPKDD